MLLSSVNHTLYQAKQRRRELQKIRALVTYQEQKFRREKRIKSKK